MKVYSYELINDVIDIKVFDVLRVCCLNRYYDAAMEKKTLFSLNSQEYIIKQKIKSSENNIANT